ncbi:tRNA 2-thiocytidine biosynthesis TtcA family protein [Ureaplasma sp. ES3154-GEN]|uniref:tRNA 2-thiocytidine biosynthesis TtcA family protein n=1 Tax=Ureaplasma sp. ES3154-GEN TaxID=2984844 RepID=UPI0021E8462E|nr:tRNA 2-thiocytidine biosynthesis TtcA family protein [Ureaplasma sp. ES3154-GEN]MCV3743707.1 tRNA 2-thiocytidine biosynthesis TtcA family protein [Ureaplasma sp. ES3154-GEN]
MRKIIGNIIKANKIFNLIQNKDKICVGVSGGKDSMTLLYVLGIFKKMMKKNYNWDIDVIGIHLKMNLCHIDYGPIIKFWADQGIYFHIEDTNMGEILRANMHKNKIQCSLCSKMKKAILIQTAKRLGCNKVAMGHHADDAIETFFMNMIYEGRIATFKPQMFLDKEQMMFIRPLILCREKDIIKAAKTVDNMPVVPCGCPMEGFTTRDGMKDFLNTNFYHAENKKMRLAYNNFMAALMNGKEFNLWFMNDNKEIVDIDLRSLAINDGCAIRKKDTEQTGCDWTDDLSDFD